MRNAIVRDANGGEEFEFISSAYALGNRSVPDANAGNPFQPNSAEFKSWRAGRRRQKRTTCPGCGFRDSNLHKVDCPTLTP